MQTPDGRPIVPVPRAMAERKPRHGAPCNGCGVCCVMTRCQIGKRLFGDVLAPCPALTQIGPHRFGCAVLTTTGRLAWSQEMRDAAALLIRAGEGCDCRVNGEPINQRFHQAQDEADAKNADAIKAAQELWDIK